MFPGFLILIYKFLIRLSQKAKYWIKVPRWVRQFPYELDRAALTRMVMTTKGTLHSPREFVFVLRDFRGKKTTENAVYTIEQEGWECTVIAQVDAPGKCVIECKRADYRVTEPNYLHDTAFFQRIAHLYKGELDGWYAGGRPIKHRFGGKYARWALIATVLLVSFGIRVGILVYIDHRENASHLQPTAYVSQEPTKPKAVYQDPSTLPSATGPNAKLSPDDMLSSPDPKTHLQTLTSKALNATFSFPDTWQMQVTQPCADPSGTLAGTSECQIQLYYKNWNQRYVPTITVQRVTGTLADVEAYQEKIFLEQQINDSSITVGKDALSVNGHSGVGYTVISGNQTSYYAYIQNGDKVFTLLGVTPLSKVPGLDYGQTYQSVLASVTLMD